MILVAGLGNVGNRFAQTRHNIGFMVVDRLAAELGATWRQESKLKAFVATAELDGLKLVLIKPTTLMNNSGQAVQRAVQFYKLAPTNVWAVFDDLDTDFGQRRVRLGGSAGGHQGVSSMIRHIGSDFNRLRIGISMNDRAAEPSEVYVLRVFTPTEQAELPAVIAAAIDQLKQLLRST